MERKKACSLCSLGVKNVWTGSKIGIKILEITHLKRRPKNEDLRPKTPWTKTKTPWTKTKTPLTKTKTPLTKTTDASR